MILYVMRVWFNRKMWQFFSCNRMAYTAVYTTVVMTA